MILHFVSLLIVIPIISENKIVFSIYSICVSISIFLHYCDFGFVASSNKYAGECFARKQYSEEFNYYGFSSFIMTIVITIIAIFFYVLHTNPLIILNKDYTSENLEIASSLLLIQSVFSFNTILLKYVSSVFQVRIEQFIFQKINILSNLIKIFSVFYFFNGSNFNIVGYFFFVKVVELVSLTFALLVIKSRYSIKFKDIIASFKFDINIFRRTKVLAFGSFVTSLIWILYYELDLIIIGKTLGPDASATYAIAFLFVQLLRTVSSVVFSPFQSRYNHFVGTNNFNELKSFLKKVIVMTMPLFVFGVISVIIFSKNIILTWSGYQYLDAASILSVLVIIHLFNFINIPVSNLLVSLEKIKLIYIINILTPILFWGGVILTIDCLGLMSFAIFKTITSFTCFVVYFLFCANFLKITIRRCMLFFCHNFGFALIIHVILLLTLTYGFSDLLPSEKSYLGFIIICMISLILFFSSIISLVITSKFYKQNVLLLFRNIKYTIS